jgi:hypothetical protein
MSDTHGPIDYVLLEFRGGHPLDEVADSLMALVLDRSALRSR